MSKGKKVIISAVETDKRDKKEVSDAVNRANILQATKLEIWSDVNKGQIRPQHQQLVADILKAAAGGSIYRGGSGE
jgi:hypothetical protein